MTPRGNDPDRDAAVSAGFGGGTSAANARPGFGGRWTGLPPVAAPRAVALPQAWRIDGARPPLDGGRPGLRGSGPLLTGVGRLPPASSLASEAHSGRSRALIRPSGRFLASARSRLAVGGRPRRRSAVQRLPLRRRPAGARGR